MILNCSFCNKPETEVRKLAAGAAGGHICDACVEACVVVMSGEGPAPPRTFDPGSWETDRLLGLVGPVNATVEAQRDHLQSIVDTLRTREVSWARIAETLGVTRQAAWERFS